MLANSCSQVSRQMIPHDQRLLIRMLLQPPFMLMVGQGALARYQSHKLYYQTESWKDYKP